jgi:hypothetical protein
MKVCSTCKDPKTLDNFYKNKFRKDGLHSQCKKCCKKYRDENAEFNKAYQKEWYLKNKFK